jgi:glycosyltransferase involved in cell wall biosynthesis
VLDSRLILCLASIVMSMAVLFQFLRARRQFTWNHEGLPPPPPGRLLSVVIPARNEESDIAPCVRSVLAQAGVEIQVIVVNDHSSDRTGAIVDELAAADPRLRVLHDPELPPMWLGKANAMQQASALATGDYLIFTDADILHRPQCFATALSEMESRSLDFLSFFPRMEWVSIWENVTLPAMIGGLALLATPGVEDPRSPDAIGVGAFMMVRTDVFRAVGGFEAIKGESLDDVCLARLVKRKGYKLGFHAAPELLEVRLFKDNAHAFWGTTKNILASLNGRYWLAPAVMALPILVFWVPLWCVAAGWLESDWTLFGAGVIGYLLQYGLLFSGGNLFRFDPVRAAFFPLVAVSVAVCIMKALYLYLWRGELNWRGRSIRVRAESSA